jgi:TonB family protein
MNPHYSNFIKALFTFPVLMAFAFTGNVQAVLQANQNQQNAVDSVYTFADKMPEFEGGEKALAGFLNKTVSYPAEAQKKNESGKVIVQFVVSKTGKVENAKVLKGVSPSLDTEALRVIGLLPDWIPGEQNGVKVSVYRILPILFKSVSEEEAWTPNEKTLVVIDNVKMPLNFDTRILSPDKLASAIILKPFPKEEKSKIISKYGRQAENGVILITSKNDEIDYVLADTLNVGINACKDPAVLPEFPGGKTQMTTYLADSIQYPFVAKQTKTQGKVFVRFLVDKTGKVSDVQVSRRADYFLDKEAVRVVSSMPNWTPSARCGEKLNIYVTIPVEFKIDIPKAEKGWERNEKTIVLLNGVRLPAAFDLKLINYTSLTSYKVLQPETKEITKKLVSEYGKDASNGVILITTDK